MQQKLFLLIPILFIVSGCHNRSFDSEKWKNWNGLNQEECNLRWDMSDDLIDNYLEKGLSFRTVEKLLCDSIEIDDKNKKMLYFNLGPCRSGISYGGLEIYFENGKLTKVDRTCR